MDNNEEDSEVSNFNGDNENEIGEDGNNIQNDNIDNIIYNYDIYNFNYIYNFMISKAILNPYIRCPLCNEKMILTNTNTYLGKKYFVVEKIHQNMILKYLFERDHFWKIFV